MKIVEVKSPESLDLTNFVTNSLDVSIFQTVDVFDKIIITSHIKGKTETFIEVNDNNIANDIRKIVDLFFKYTNYGFINLEIKVERSKINLIDNYYNILAGVLLGLNVLFQNTLHKHELIYLGNQVNNLIGYYIECGYKKIDINNKFYKFGNNEFLKYIVLKSNSKEELLSYKKLILEMVREQVQTSIDNNYIIIPFKNNQDLTHEYNMTFIKLKHEFKNLDVMSLSNLDENKILVRYLK